MNSEDLNKLYQSLLDGNKIWVEARLKENPDFFKELALSQNPPVLWIGCSDSRVPANEITNTRPGEVFVHRNIANMVVHTDINLLSVIDYATSILQVKHIIVCGHYNCGGINAALSKTHFGLIDNWLRNIKDVYRLHQAELDACKDHETRARRLVELNVIEQVANLGKTSAVQNAWDLKRPLMIHGWVYDVANGIIQDLKVSRKNNEDMADIYKFDF
ncbi:MAG TPA: carbonic anhydrase [Bacteroidia bacterium]|jgi:carbonic anhydrase|nr:carbonic anhydrase [Bacteroidia bacterium]